MIHWPSEDALTPAARANLERFKVTAAARELERDPRTWTVAEWSWTEEPSMHVLLRNERLVEILFSFDDTGTWRLQQGQDHFVPQAVLNQPEDAVEAEAVLEAPRWTDRLRRVLRHPERSSN